MDSKDIESSTQYKPEVFVELLNSIGEHINSLKPKLKEISEAFPEHETVQSTLKDYIRTKEDLNNSFKAKSASVSGKGAEYAKSKLPKVKQDVSTKLTKYQFEFELGEARQVKPEELLDGLNVLVKILDVDGKFEKLLREFEEVEENENAADVFEKWKDETLAEVNKLKNKVTKIVKPIEAQNQKGLSTYQAQFKKSDPPKFSGDCLDYLEWKTKWESVVTVCNLPAITELDKIKENIPEKAKNRLYEANSLPMAWKILDKTYGDKRLITQKLKSKMKNLKPVSKEPHEIIIEIHEQYDFLVKRLAKLGEKDLLETDLEYLNSIYLHLPEKHKWLWEDFDVDTYNSEWKAFAVFFEDQYDKALRQRIRM